MCNSWKLIKISVHHFGVITMEVFGYENINQKFLLIYISKIFFSFPNPTLDSIF